MIAVGIIALGIIYGLPYLRKPDIDHLVETALTAATDSEQVDAAQQLAQLGEPALEGMRKLLQQSSNEDVVAVSIVGVARLSDYQCMDPILNKLDDSSVTVRSAAASAAAKLLGRNHHFPVTGPPDQRARVRDQMIKDWEEYNGSELFKFNQNRFKN